MELSKWDKRFIKRAQEVATWSKDQNTKIGAVVVNSSFKSAYSDGFNGLARGVNDCIITFPERHSRENDEKYYWYEHGERNALWNCARHGYATLGATMYLNCGIPCCPCAHGIIQSGIKKVFCVKQDQSSTANRNKWNEHAKRSLIQFQEAGVELVQYSPEDLI